MKLFAILANFFLLGSDLIMFLRFNGDQISVGNFSQSDFSNANLLLIPQSWSLSIELFFYLLAPLLCKVSTRILFTVSITLIVSRQLVTNKLLIYDPWTYRFSLFELVFFIFGILIFRHRLKMAKLVDFILHSNILRSCFWISTLALFVVSGYIETDSESLRLVKVLLLIVSAVIPASTLGSSILDRKIGELSYPIYISHILIIHSVFVAQERFRVLDEFIYKSKLSTNLSLLGLVILFSGFLIKLNHPIERIRDRIRINAMNS